MISFITISKITFSNLKTSHLSHTNHDSTQLNQNNFFSVFRLARGPRGQKLCTAVKMIPQVFC